MCAAVQVWERPAIAVSHMPTGEKWAKGYDLQLRFYDIQQYPEVGAAGLRHCHTPCQTHALAYTPWHLPWAAASQCDAVAGFKDAPNIPGAKGLRQGLRGWVAGGGVGFVRPHSP